MKNIKFIPVVILLLISGSLFADDLRFIVSKIENQEVFINSRVEINFSSLNNTFDVVYSSPNSPSFVIVENLAKGYGKFVIEPKLADIGEYIIELKGDVASNGATHSQKFRIIVSGVDSFSKIYYLDPVNGSDTNDGGASTPLKTVEKITESDFDIDDGAIVYMRSGNYGSIDFSRSNNKMVYVVAEAGHSPKAEFVRFNFSKNWTVSGLKISPSVASKQQKGKYVIVSGATRNVVLRNCEIYGTPEISDWPTNKDWGDYAGNGIECKGTYCSFRSNYIYNTNFPVQIFLSHNDVSYNLVVNFAGDALRGIGDYCNFTYNQIKNAVVYDYYAPGGNHDDAFQSWTNGSSVKGIVFKGNQITDISYPSLPLQTKIMQGVVDFDGFAEDWIIQDNLVVIHHQHGITLLGARNCKIVNNSVIKNPFSIYNNGNPWIGVWPTKPTAGSKSSTGNLVRNNIIGAFTDTSPPAPQGKKDVGDVDHNFVTPHFNNIFVNYSSWDFHLKANTVAINKGEKEGGSTVDIEGFIRNVGEIDLGCFERGGNVLDYDSPSDIGIITVDELGPTYAKLSWEPPTDNTGIKLYYLSFEDREIIIDEPRCFITDLYSNNDYTFKIYAEDFAGNKTKIKSVSVITPSFDGNHNTIYVGGVYADQEITNKNKRKWAYSQFMKVGGIDDKMDLAGVMVFKIPSTPYGKKIIDANLSIYYDKRVGFPSGAVDLYGLNFERNSLLKENVFWQGDYADSDGIGVPISDDFIAQIAPSGYIESDLSASSELLKYYNLQLENGAHGNNYLFLRLNVDVKDEDANSYYNIASADNYSSFKRPLIKFKLDIDTPTIDFDNDDIQIYPNPAINVLNISNIDGELDYEIIDLFGKVYWKGSIKKSDNTILVDELNSGIFFVKFRKGSETIVKKFIKF